jgi:hypothetical protein
MSIHIIYPETAKEQLETYLNDSNDSADSAAKELITSCIPRSFLLKDENPAIVEKIVFDSLTITQVDAITRAASLLSIDRTSSKSSVTGDDPASVSIALSLNDFSENTSFRSRGSTFESLSSFVSEMPQSSISSLTPSAIAVSIDFNTQPSSTVSTKSGGLKGLKALKGSSSTNDSSINASFITTDVPLSITSHTSAASSHWTTIISTKSS